MIFKQIGEAVKSFFARPAPGRQILPDPVSDRDSFNVSRRLAPRDVDRIMCQANSGDIEAQCRLARELPEQNAAVRHTVSTRRNAVAGCRWSIQPADESPAAKEIAARLEKMLEAAGSAQAAGERLDSFQKTLKNLTDALLPGFAASEIVWIDGGESIAGFKAVEQKYFSFSKGFSPRLRVMGNYDGIELPPCKIIFHRVEENGSDPARGGLIRPLAWLHCFANITEKDLLSFVERYGMPFIVAKVDQATYEKEGTVLQRLISAFGPRGGGVFSRAAELELLQAANTTGEVYFRLLEYVEAAITKVVLGQTASSGDSSGLSKGDAQSSVRQDILDADARELEDTVNYYLIAPWMSFNYPPGTAAPRLVIASEAAEDTAILSTTVKTLFDAGFEADPAEMSQRFGFKLKRREMPAPAPYGFSGVPNLEAAEKAVGERGSKALETWLSPLAAELEKLAQIEDPEEFRLRLAELLDDSPFGDSEAFEDALAQVVESGIAAGGRLSAHGKEGDK